jgi:IS1 family transposase
MNKLSDTKRAAIVRCLIEGNSESSTSRIVGVSPDTVSNLSVSVGGACALYLNDIMRDLPCTHIQVDEIWTFCSAKEKNVSPEFKGQIGHGDVYVWTSLCADTKLIVSHLVGKRDSAHANRFMEDLAWRVPNLKQLTSDGFAAYPQAVERAFGGGIDFAMLVKEYGGVRTYRDGTTKKCTSRECSNITKKVISGNPDPDRISTNGIERSNLTLRMSSRRFTREINAFSKKFLNLCHGTALNLMFYNFGRIHKTLRCTPAQQAGLSSHIWSLEEIAALSPIEAPKMRGPYKKAAKTS